MIDDHNNFMFENRIVIFWCKLRRLSRLETIKQNSSHFVCLKLTSVLDLRNAVISLVGTNLVC